MKIRFRLLWLMIAMTSVAVVAALLVASYLTREALESDANEKLSAVLEARHGALLRHLDTTYRQLAVLSASPATAQSLSVLTAAFAKLGNHAPTLLQSYYAVEGARQDNVSLPIHSDYDRAYTEAYPLLFSRNALFKWTDMFLVDPQGNVVFSALRRKDFASNLLTGSWKTSGLARAVAPLLHDAMPNVVSFADFEHYAPSGNRPAAFLATPVFDPERKVFLGVLAIQLPVQQINELMQDKTGLGKSGETFVVGKAGWMLTDSRFRQEGATLGVQLKTQAVSRVLNGESGLATFPDYRGIDVSVAFKPIRPFEKEINLGDQAHWGVIAKIDRAEIFEEFYQLRQMLLLTGSGLILFAVLMGFWGAHTITRPLLGLRNALTKLTQGESVTVPHLDRDDEIGDMAQTAEAFRKVTQQVAHDHWIAENVTALTHAISVETRLHAAASNVLHLLCQQLEIPVGAIYLLGAGGGFQRVAAHGLARRSQAEDDFALGEGLVGQCAKDQQVVVLSPVPSGLSIISTGLAEFPPHELVLYPLVYKDKVIGVLEFAVAQSLTPLQHDFLHTVSTTLGLHLSNLQAAEHNLVLLAETRTQSQELTAQQESLLKNNEEMRALSEELRSQSEEMKTQNEELKANQEEMRAQQEEMRHKNKLLESQSTQLEGVLADVKRKAQDLARANQYKSEFLANMSHELRTPLNSVLILSKDLAENETHNLTPEQVESASVISDSGMQLLTLINDILDLSKIESGKLELLKESFQLHELLTYLRRLFTPQIEKKQLNLHIDIADGVAETITTDRQRLVQILSNLLSNAIKFTDKGTVSILVSREGESLQFAVTDTGIGIPADKLDHIFGSFQQLDGSTSRKYGGSGLGLTISRQLARLLGGEIDVTSQLGKGSCFVVRLFHQVADVAPPVSPVAAVTLPVATVQGNILVVEDDARLLAILARMVKTLGFSPLCVESAEQALAAIAREKPLGILLDLGLPKMSGMALLRHLKADTATANLPVYIMSGSVDDGEAKLLGALGFLKKPLTRETLEQAINSLLAAQKSVKRILLVDENPAETEELQHLFQHDACQLISADAGQNALQLLEAQHFDAVILGLSLPDMTGFAWLKQAQHLLNPPPVVVYSADALSEAQVFELKERVESIVTKNGANERLHEEVLLAAQMGSYANKMKMPNNEVFAGKKLLLVDDDARNLFALTRVLRSKGFVIEVAADAVHALAMLNQTHFDALLTDIMMPEMDGYALIRQVRALGYHALPIIAITAKAMQGDDALCLQAGATAYLPKPVDVASLLEILKKV